MKYQYKYETRAMDLWQLSMYATYRSIVGLINIIFTIAMIILTVTYWSQVNGYLKVLLLLGILLFTVIQPLLVYQRAKKQLAGRPRDMEIGFDDQGVHVRTGEEKSTLKWKKIRGVTKNPTMLIIYSSTTHGFILTNKVLGKERDALHQYVLSKLGKS